jgi:hypothetical protein
LSIRIFNNLFTIIFLDGIDLKIRIKSINYSTVKIADNTFDKKKQKIIKNFVDVVDIFI